MEEKTPSRCGLGSCAPDYLQACSNLTMFSCSAGVLFLLQQTTVTYLASQVVNLEKAFGLSSTASGIILSSNEIGFVVSVIFLTYFGRDIHIPRYFGILGLIFGFATAVCCIPHFVKQTHMSNDQQLSGANISSSEAYFCTDADVASPTNHTCSAADNPATESNNLWMYGACVAQSSAVVIPGVCDDHCPFLYYHITILFIVGLCMSLGSTPTAIFIVRCTEERDQAVAMGLFSFSISLIGLLPAPILFGAVVDSTCTIWSTTCGERGACALYDVVNMRLRMTGLALGLRLAALVGAITSYVGLTFDKSTPFE
ncbi:solute carrier organic anion transporter family member 74D-like [Haliotis asinina]|uniref:solute carrier organic anion transporter family member 74D-like n=1 Tax=Haliotis asinina TaxID=109174 RepID=UPI00353208D1